MSPAENEDHKDQLLYIDIMLGEAILSI